MKITFEQVSDCQVEQLAVLADEIWHEYFTCILSAEQIDYMVEKFQSAHAIGEQRADQGYVYYFICLDGTPGGFIGVCPEGDSLFLSKIYLKDKYRGKGIASQAFVFLEELCRSMGKKSIWLTVNKYNEHSIAVYEKKGFHTIRSQVTDIGKGFVMDDYVMEKKMEE